ncbi:MAG: methionine adenosyltransferase [Candidatus Promineifilaceae bacterium]|nr:methionine adenosyltransferase [Candidatus Promineifilaceae bacterium]
MTINRNVVVTEAAEAWIEKQPVEIVDRKGLGHPDSLCDGMAERISVAYTRWCLQHLGAPLHHNFDKLQLVAGEVDVDFGRGQLLQPIRVQIAGRGSPVAPDGQAVPMDILAIDAAKAHLRESLRYLNPDRHCVVECYAGRGDSQLISTVEEVTANDTSFGVAHWPLSRLEQTVLDTANYLNHELLDQYPIGEDIKVMGARLDGQIILTCAVPFLALEVDDLDHYRQLKESLRATVQRFVEHQHEQAVTIHLNTADNGSAYLTLTGTSAEAGDDGAVGRGNRISGLITPFRLISLEAAAGKNPISHVGKLYNAVAQEAAQRIVAEVAAARRVEVILLSQIGQPLDQPLVAQARVYPDQSLPSSVKNAIAGVVDECLDDIDSVRQAILRREIALF